MPFNEVWMAKRREKQEKAYDMHKKAGMTLREVGEHFGVKHPTIVYWIKQVEERRKSEGDK